MSPTKEQAVGEEPTCCPNLDELRRWPRLSKDGRECLAPDTAMATAWRTLWLKRQEVDAIWALAATLPMRRAVWWATLAAWNGVGGMPNDAEHQAFAAVMAWLRQPDPERAARAGQCAAAVGLNNPIGSAARAASLPPGLEAAETAATAVFLAQQRASRDKLVAYADYLALGRSVADGSLTWN